MKWQMSLQDRHCLSLPPSPYGIVASWELVFRAPLLRLYFRKCGCRMLWRIPWLYFFLHCVVLSVYCTCMTPGASIFRAQENTRGPMVISIISNVMNIAGNAILIWVFHMGVAGAAISTLVSRIFCAVVVLYQLRKDRQQIVVRDYLKIRPNGRMIGRILALGVPSGVENSMFQLGKLAIQSTVSTLGTVAIAAQAMTNIMETLNGTAVIGVGIGLMTVVGQSLGAGRKDEAVYYMKKLMAFSEVLLIACCVVVLYSGKADYCNWRNGAAKCKDVSGNDVLDYNCETDCMDAGVYSCIWNESCRGCEVFS